MASRTRVARYFLETRRLGFRSWKEDDFGLAFGLWGDPEVTRLFDARGRLSTDQVRRRLAEEIATEREHGVQYWPIFLLATGEHVGCCGLRPHDPEARIYELGVHIRSSHWRRGFAAEAASAAIEHASRRLGAGGLFAGHHPNNDGSRRLLEKLGFRYTHDELYPPTGLRHPSYILTPSHGATHEETMSKTLQIYETPELEVSFDPTVCVHSGVCVRGLPAVFDIRRKRWVRPELAPAADVIAQVARCPSGALQSQLKKEPPPSHNP